MKQKRRLRNQPFIVRHHDAVEGRPRIVSKRMLHVEIDAAGNARNLHYAPYLDYRPLAADEPGPEAILSRAESSWIGRSLD